MKRAAEVSKPARPTPAGDVVGRIGPRLYDAQGVPITNQILQGDCVDLLDRGPEGWVDLAFADPPFNIGYLYDGYDDQKPLDKYLDWSRRWMTAVTRALSPPTGSFFLAIGDDYAADLCVIARRELGLHLRNWIVWHYTFGQQPKHKFARSHTHLLYFSKDPKKFTFNADAVRVKSARQTVYKDARANKKGKLPDDTWYLRPQETQGDLFNPDQDVWNESRVCGTFKEREGWHGCQMPIAVLDRVIKAASHPGDVVLDPFNGSGTTCLSAALLGRQYVGLELNGDYVSLARQRVAHALEKVEDLRALNGPGATTGTIELSKVLAHITGDSDRASKVRTDTDALGRPRVERPRRKQSA